MAVSIIELSREYSTKRKCVRLLQSIRWGNTPQCPYCQSTKSSPRKQEFRYQCNTCNRSYSVTVGTIFHNSKLSLTKWFLAIFLVLNAKKGIAARQLARDLGVDKDTAWYLQMRIRIAMRKTEWLLAGIVEAGKAFSGRDSENKTQASLPTKVPGKAPDPQLQQLIRVNGAIGEETGRDHGLPVHFRGLPTIHFPEHVFVGGNIPIYPVEGFWSLLKRGINGQYHMISIRYFQNYVDEFSFRYTWSMLPNLFRWLLTRAVNLNPV